MINQNIPVTLQNIYTKNEKVYTYFCYRNLFFTVINREFKNQMIEYQQVNFLHGQLMPSYFAVIRLVKCCYSLLIGKFYFIAKLITYNFLNCLRSTGGKIPHFVRNDSECGLPSINNIPCHPEHSEGDSITSKEPK